LPVAAYGGSRELMERVSPLGPVYQAGTLSGNPLGMAAGIATLELCRGAGFYEQLHQRATRLMDGLCKAAGEHGVSVQTTALGGMMGLAFVERPVRNFDDAKAGDHARFARFFHAMLDEGVWLPPSGYEAMFVSGAHGDAAVAVVIEAARQSFRRIRS
jgi:glutamate-1-semialdehyde 2,1-aminomutase